MKLDIRAFAIAIAVIWAGAILVVGLANVIWPTYGNDFLVVMASIYPGYQADSSIGQVLNGTLYAAVDGLIGGAILAWVYNLLIKN